MIHRVSDFAFLWQKTVVEPIIQFLSGMEAGTLDLESDLFLVAAGRRPNVEGLDLERAGIAFDGKGIEVDDRLRFSNPRIFACGDVVSRFKFTYAADAQALMALRNALLFGRKRTACLIILRVTYTDPEIAHVGRTRREAEAAGLKIGMFWSELYLT